MFISRHSSFLANTGPALLAGLSYGGAGLGKGFHKDWVHITFVGFFDHAFQRSQQVRMDIAGRYDKAGIGLCVNVGNGRAYCFFAYVVM